MKQKTYLILAIALLMSTGLAFQSFAQGCTDLFFSEYLEGSSGNNKCVEIYNPTATAIDLSAGAYKVQVFANGAASAGSTINLTGTIGAYGTYVLCNSGATMALLSISNQTSGSLSHNGNDALALVKGTGNTYVDIIGRIGNDPGTAWTSGALSTANQILRRISAVQSGITINPSGTGAGAFTTLGTEWGTFSDTDYTGFGSHTSSCTPVTPCSITSIELTGISACNDNGTPLITNDDFFTANVVVRYFGVPASDSLVLNGDGGRLAALPGPIDTSSYTFTAVQFATDGTPVSLTAAFKNNGACTLTNLNAGIAPSSCSTPPPCTLPFFSEYIEGTGNNKCVEIYNPSTSAINLAAYGLFLSFNGGNSTSTLPLNGTIAPGGTFVLCSGSAAPEFIQLANQTTNANLWNGNDVIILQDANGVIDAIGQLGNASDYGADVTLRRKSNITAGDNNPNDPFTTAEWNTYPVNTSAGLGYHIGSCPTGAPAGWAFANPGCAAGSTTAVSGTWTQSSNCYNPASGADDLTFAFRELCGDGEIVAQYQGVTPFGFAGLMMRESLNPASKYVWMFMRANTNASWAIRAITGLAPTIDTRPHANRQWMKLTRTGTTFRGYLSANGTTWQLVFQSSVSLNSCVLVGLATHSNVDGNNVTSTFRNVSTSFSNNLTAMPGAAQAVDMVSEAPAMQTAVIQSGNTTESDAFGIWPNPAGSTLEVNIPMWNAGESVQLQVNDMQGRPLMYRQLGDQQQRVSLDLSTLTPGMYLLTLRSGEHLEIARFIKQ